MTLRSSWRSVIPITRPGMLECLSACSIVAAASVSLAFTSSASTLPGNADQHSANVARPVHTRVIASMPWNVEVQRNVEETPYGIHDGGIVAVRVEPLAQWARVEYRYLGVCEIVHACTQLERREP